MTTSAGPHGHLDDQAAEIPGRTPPPGIVAGAVLRAARLSAGVSEATLAVASGVSEDTIRSWENGSSPLAQVPDPDIQRLETALDRAGAEPRLVADLGVAAWCDLIIVAISSFEATDCLLADPVTSSDAFGDLLSWCLAGRVPDRYRRYTAPLPLIADSALIERAIKILDA